MAAPSASASPARRIEQQQRQQLGDEQRSALRALLMQPLMGAQHPALPLVRRHAQGLREWFQREAGWPLQVDRDGARLFKRPADLADPTRGLPRFDRARYVLLCLACAALDRADAQITLRALGEKLLTMAAEPSLAGRGFSFALQSPAERRALVAVCQTLLALGVLHRVAGDEEAYVQGGAPQGDALYDLRRRALAGMLAAVRGPSSWPAGQAPVALQDRLAALVREHHPETEEGQRTALRHALSRRLLDDPVVYLDDLPPAERAYFANQRGLLAGRLAEATGLQAEQRAEGTALTDEGAELSDLALPAEGTESHVTLLVAEHLAGRLRSGHAATCSRTDVATFLVACRQQHGRFWRKQAREPGSESELASTALHRLAQLQLVLLDGEHVQARPALARYTLGSLQFNKPGPPVQGGLWMDDA